LGPFRLDTSNGLLFRDAEPLSLGRRAIALLQTLVERPGALVSKDTLIEAAWSGQAVEDSNLTVQIAALRRVLGEAPGGDRWIETMPRRGYRFVGPGVAIEENGVTAPPSQVDISREAPPITYRATRTREQVDIPWETAPVAPSDAERRQITILSSELVGVAAGAGRMDLEDLRDAVGSFRRCVSEMADRHSGTIHGHLGNKALVLFGYPKAHEDDAERAVRAGLELCAAVRALSPDEDAPMRCRVGIATGMVIIGDHLDAGAPRDQGIVGEVPSTATRLLISVLPGAVAIDPATRRLIGELFDCRDLGEIETDAAAEPLRHWRVMTESHIASRFEALRGANLSRLVGRDEEIDLLLRRWTRAKAGDGQIVLLSGEAGIGKSRLAAALEERLHAEPHLRLRFFCSPHHQDSPLFPFIEQLGRAAGFARDETAATRMEKLEGMLAGVMPLDEDVVLLADLLSLQASTSYSLANLNPRQKKQRTFGALLRQLEGLVHQHPILMVFEDAHWIDPTSRELLDLTVERLCTLPVLLIVTFRPEFEPPWTGQPQVTMLTLNRLDRRDRCVLVQQVAGGKELPEEVVTQIADRTDGVPLFVEELTKGVLESGVLRESAERYVLDRALPAFAIPTTLHDSLMERLDRLAPVRRLAQIGAAIGRQFSYALLRLRMSCKPLSPGWSLPSLSFSAVRRQTRSTASSTRW
jgi:class 3 adenylate cyclase